MSANQLQTSLVPIRFYRGDHWVLPAPQGENKQLPEIVSLTDPAYVCHVSCGSNDVQHVLTVSSNAAFGGTITYKCSKTNCIVNKPGYVQQVNTP